MTALPIIEQEEIRAMTRQEFLRVIGVRRERLASAREALREWQQALSTADRFWTGHPGWSLGQRLEAILAASSQNNPTAPTTEGTH